jgi:esterase/lipase
MGIDPSEAVQVFEPIYNGITGLTVEDHNIIPKFKNVHIPTFFFQVRDDSNSRWTDVQEMFDNTPVEDKKIVFMEGTPLRFKGYNYFSEQPEEMVEWFDTHM